MDWGAEREIRGLVEAERKCREGRCREGDG